MAVSIPWRCRANPGAAPGNRRTTVAQVRQVDPICRRYPPCQSVCPVSEGWGCRYTDWLYASLHAALQNGKFGRARPKLPLQYLQVCFVRGGLVGPKCFLNSQLTTDIIASQLVDEPYKRTTF